MDLASTERKYRSLSGREFLKYIIDEPFKLLNYIMQKSVKFEVPEIHYTSAREGVPEIHNTFVR